MTNELKRFLHFLFFTNIYTFLIVSLIFIFIFLGERYNKKNEFQQQVRTINFFIDQQDISPMVKLKFLKCMKENLHLTYINNHIVYKYYLPSECVNQKREPFPSSELTPMRPPTCSTILLQIDNPKPVP